MVVAVAMGGGLLLSELRSSDADGRRTSRRLEDRAARRSAAGGRRRGWTRRWPLPSDDPHRQLPARPAGRGQAGQPPGSDVLRASSPAVRPDRAAGRSGKNQGVLLRLVEQLNAASGRSYDFATCPTQQRDALEHYTRVPVRHGRIEVDRTTVHFVEDPLGASASSRWRARSASAGPDPAEAFTFTLINVETDPENAAAELDVLAAAYRAVRDSRPRAKTTSSCWATWRATTSISGQLGKLLGVTALLSRRADHRPRRQSAGQHSCWTAGQPVSSPAGWRWST